MSITYRTYLDGALTSGFQLYNTNPFFGTIFDYIVTGHDGPGVAVSSDPLAAMQNPNAIPDVQALYPTLKGINANEGGVFSAQPWIGIPFLSGMSEARFFFRALQVQPRWKIGSDTVNLSYRWVGGGYEAWTGYQVGTPDRSVNRQEWSHGKNTPARDYTLTDENGIATYIALFGVALLQGGDWFLFSPANTNGIPVTPETPVGRGNRNLAFVLRQNELARPSISYPNAVSSTGEGFTPTSQPYDDVHIIGQLSPGTGNDAGYHLSLDYGAKWDGVTGFLDLSGVSSPITFDYEQSGKVTVLDSDGNPMNGAEVSFGASALGGPYTGTTNSDGIATIPALPRGSWLNETDALPDGNVQSLPLADASDYPASVSSAVSDPDKPSLKPQRTPSLSGDPDGLEFEATYTGKTGDTLTGVLSPDGLNPYGVKKSDLYGGEVATLPYTDFTVTVGGSPVTIADAHGPNRLYIREETGGSITLTTGTSSDGSIDADGLDCAQDPFKEPFFFESREPVTREHVGIDMEASFAQKDALAETLKCPSECILPDGERLLGAVQDGAVKLWRTRDLWATSDGPTVLSDAHTFKEVILREGPDGMVNAHLTRDDGQVFLALSPDGGDTWTDSNGTEGQLTELSDLPPCRFERGDLRHDGVSGWLRLHPWSGSPSSPGVNLYSSHDGGVTWEFENVLDLQAKWPWLIVNPDGTLTALYHDGSHIACKIGTPEGIGWSWGSKVQIVDADVTGAVGFSNGQKTLIAFRAGKDTVKYFKSLDGAATWQEGSEG